MTHGDYEVLVIGGGPAGMTAALYAARYDRSVALFDRAEGRGQWHQINYNYLGFVGGISARELGELGREQIAAYPQITTLNRQIESIERENNIFIAASSTEQWHGQTVILCTGTDDHWPQFENWREYIGRSMFWCITCDGYETIGKRMVVIGNSDEAACTAVQFTRLTDQITLLTNCMDCNINQPFLWRLEQAGIPVIVDELDHVVGKGGYFETLITTQGHCLDLERLFSLQGANPRNALAKQLGVNVDAKGYIQVDTEQKTNVPGVYAAGDITCVHSHQFAAASHEGGQAASAANYYLYPPNLKHT